MKKIISLLSILIFTTNVLAQNVGIGTLTPSANLEIKKAQKSVVKISSNGFTDTTQLIFNNRTSANFGTTMQISSNQEQGLRISSSSDLPSNTKDTIMQITPQGNVGIGSADPLGRLDVIGAGSTAATNTFSLRNSSLNTLLKMTDDGALNVGNPTGVDSYLYRLRVESGNRGSLFIENPVVAANATVKILRDIAEPDSRPNTTALLVEAGNDYASRMWGRGGISATSTFAPNPGGEFISAPGGLALRSIGNVSMQNIGEAAGRVLISDALGNATWKNSTKYTSIIPPSCQVLLTATSTYAKIADLGSFTKDNLDTKIELIFQTHLRVNTISGVAGATYELRIDNLPTTNGNARASVQLLGQNVNASIFGLYTGLSSGLHTVSIWARSGAQGNIGGTATDVSYDSGCWSASNLTVKETF